MLKTLKRTGLGLAALITLLICVSFILPGKVHVSRSTVINAPAQSAYDQVNTLKNWEKWSPWHQMDTTMLLVYEGPAAGQGARYAWESAAMGNGSLAITSVTPNQLIETEMNFGEMGISRTHYSFEPVEEGTKVTWTMDTDGSGVSWKWYVPGKYLNLFMDDMLGKDFEKGLSNLKNYVESLPAGPVPVQIFEKKVDARPVLTIKAVCSQQELAEKLTMLYAEIDSYIQKNDLEAAGRPFAVYHAYDPKKITFEAGIPVVRAGKSAGNIKAWEQKAGRVVLATHYGEAEKTYDAHMLIDAYLKRHNLQQTASPWEVYVTDRQQESDPNRRLTEIYYPVK
jgi:effector-binding domain-containing protein